MPYTLQSNAPPSKLIFFDSRDALYNSYQTDGQPYTSDVTFNFKSALQMDHHVDTLISVDQVSLPFSFYLIREGENDRVKIRMSTFWDETAYVDAYLVFPSGNFTFEQLADEMQTLLLEQLEAIKVSDAATFGDYTMAPRVLNLAFKDKLLYSWYEPGFPAAVGETAMQTPDMRVRFMCAEGGGSTMSRELGLAPNNDGFFAVHRVTKPDPTGLTVYFEIPLGSFTPPSGAPDDLAPPTWTTYPAGNPYWALWFKSWLIGQQNRWSYPPLPSDGGEEPPPPDWGSLVTASQFGGWVYRVPIDFEAFHDDYSDGAAIAGFIRAAVGAASPGGTGHYTFDTTLPFEAALTGPATIPYNATDMQFVRYFASVEGTFQLPMTAESYTAELLKLDGTVLEPYAFVYPYGFLPEQAGCFVYLLSPPSPEVPADTHFVRVTLHVVDTNGSTAVATFTSQVLHESSSDGEIATPPSSSPFNRTIYPPALPVCSHATNDPSAAYLLESEWPFRLAAYSQTAAATMGLRPGEKIASVLNLPVAATPTGAASQSTVVSGNTSGLVGAYGFYVDGDTSEAPQAPSPSATVSRLTIAAPGTVPPAPAQAHVITGNPPSNLVSLPGMLSQNCLDLRSSIHSVCIRSNLTSTSCLDTVSMNFTDVLCRIPINAETGGIISYTGSHAFQPLTKMRDLKTIRFQITDGRGRVLWLNGLNWQISIMLSFVYQSKPIAPLSKEEKSFISHHEDRPRLKKLMAHAAKKSPPQPIIHRRIKPKQSNGTVLKTRRKTAQGGTEPPGGEDAEEPREAAGDAGGR
jgi:hypothetical protein